MTWVKVEKYLRRHRHPFVRRFCWRTHRYAATFACSSVIGQQEQVVIADGAPWIKMEAQKHFSQATCILDWPHLWRTIAKAVRAVALQREADQTWMPQ
ncbi:MAG TPA: hypothetical protein VFN02_00770 [Ktedonobacteraceae bacterium]|nr:hypothetical protein [Ktedonobacteraceae bacterium]